MHPRIQWNPTAPPPTNRPRKRAEPISAPLQHRKPLGRDLHRILATRLCRVTGGMTAWGTQPLQNSPRGSGRAANKTRPTHYSKPAISAQCRRVHIHSPRRGVGNHQPHCLHPTPPRRKCRHTRPQAARNTVAESRSHDSRQVGRASCSTCGVRLNNGLPPSRSRGVPASTATSAQSPVADLLAVPHR